MNEPTYNKYGVQWLNIVAALGCIVVIFALVIPYINLFKHHDSPSNACMNNQRQLAIAIMAYIQDNGEVLPLPPDWVAVTSLTQDPRVFNCPVTKFTGTPSAPEYGMNACLARRDAKTGTVKPVPIALIADPTVIELTADIRGLAHAGSPFPGTYTAAGIEGAGGNCRLHDEGKSIVVSYVDGHTARIDASAFGTGKSPYNIHRTITAK